VAKWTRVVGVMCVVLGLAGYLTVADDLRHRGELFGVSLVVAAGLILFGISFRRARS